MAKRFDVTKAPYWREMEKRVGAVDKLPVKIEQAKARWVRALLVIPSVSQRSGDVAMATGRANLAEAALDRLILEAINEAHR